MPFPRAYLVLLLIVPLTLVAFWRGYVSALAQAPLAFHVHGVTASLWILLLIFQSWSIHRGLVKLHRMAGASSFALFPAFVAGALLVLHSLAERQVAGGPFAEFYAARLGAFDVIAVVAFIGLYAAAIRHRQDVQRHARYMLATALLVLAPVLSRVYPLVIPPLAPAGIESLPRFAYSMQLANLTALVAALALYAAGPRHGLPFLITAAVVACQIVAFQFSGALPWWRDLYAELASVPQAMVGATGIVIAWVALYLARRRKPEAAPSR
jgi:uncharacterized membrane protein YozB (DUF420 family)